MMLTIADKNCSAINESSIPLDVLLAVVVVART